MESSNGADCQGDIADAKIRQMSILQEEYNSRKKKTSPDHNNADIGHSESVGIVPH